MHACDGGRAGPVTCAIAAGAVARHLLHAGAALGRARTNGRPRRPQRRRTGVAVLRVERVVGDVGTGGSATAHALPEAACSAAVAPLTPRPYSRVAACGRHLPRLVGARRAAVSRNARAHGHLHAFNAARDAARARHPRRQRVRRACNAGLQSMPQSNAPCEQLANWMAGPPPQSPHVPPVHARVLFC